MTTVAGWEDVADEQLLGTFVDETRSRSEREAAFRHLVTRYRHRVFAVCFRVLDDRADAEDAAQETFIKLARGADAFRGDAKLSTWLYRVARNVCTDRIRYEARRPSTPVDDIGAVGTEPRVEDVSEVHATATVVGAALAQLDVRSRQLLLLVAVDGLSYAEAAEVTDLAVGTVKSRVSRARVRLGELLDAGAGDPSVRPTGPVADPRTDGGAEPARPGPRGPPSG
jgi:RNA polymerase sigma-70 factor, ECF subfamily